MLSNEQIEEIKKQIFKQIDSWRASEEKKEEAKKQIESMSSEELESFLEQNKLVKKNQECVFCMIVNGKIPTYKLAENQENLAVLEINPSSKCHSLIIPKKHIKNNSELPQSSHILAKEIAERIRHFLSPKEVLISSSNLFGHEVISIIPDYGKKEEKRKTTEEELKELQALLTSPIKQEKKIEKKQEEKPKKLEKAPRRIP